MKICIDKKVRKNTYYGIKTTVFFVYTPLPNKVLIITVLDPKNHGVEW